MEHSLDPAFLCRKEEEPVSSCGGGCRSKDHRRLQKGVSGLLALVLLAKLLESKLGKAKSPECYLS